jgi:hypothetical protein
MEKTAPKGAIDQIGESLLHIIHAFSEADEDANVFMMKWDTKDGFWRMDCETGRNGILCTFYYRKRVNRSK